MKIAKLEAIPLKVPFSIGPVEPKMAGRPWTAQEILLIRAETAEGLVGWGEAFSYGCQDAVKAAFETMVAPHVLSREVEDIPAFAGELQRMLHLNGRYGLVNFALSGLDIALWDLAAKAAGKPLARLIDESAPLTPMSGYASLYRYGDAELVAAKCQEALDKGYGVIKLHEITESEIKAARDQIGGEIPLTVDTNCPWTPDEARDMALRFKAYDLLWLEEPLFPPDDYVSLAALQAEVGIPLAAGENLCTAQQFGQMIDAGAVTYLQPSVTKIGGVSEFLATASLTRGKGLKLMPHCPYFGPGFLATLQLMSALPDSGIVERLYVDLEASLYGAAVDPVEGAFAVPDGPGLGMEPDADVIKTFRVQ